MREPPQALRVPRLLYADATPEALAYALANGWPSGGVLSAEAGAVFGAHSMTHRPLPGLPMDEAASEILDSKSSIEDRTGAAVECFAYPYGEYTQPIADVVAKNFRVGLSTDMGFLTTGSRFEALERIDAYYLRGTFWIDRLFAPLGGSYIACQAAARGLKKRFEQAGAKASAQ